jgi:hypothetical protein
MAACAVNDNVDKTASEGVANNQVIAIDTNKLKFTFNDDEYAIGISTYQEFSSQSGFAAIESYNYPDQVNGEFYLEAQQHSAYELKNQTNSHTLILHITNKSDEQKNISNCVITGIRLVYNDWDMETFEYDCAEPDELIVCGVSLGEQYSNIRKVWGAENKSYHDGESYNVCYYINDNEADYVTLTMYDKYGITGIEFVVDMFC